MPRRRTAVLSALVLSLAACGGDSERSGAFPAAGAQTETGTIAAETTQTEPPATGTAAQARRGVRLAPVGRFDAPLFVTSPPQDQRRLFVVEQGGKVRVVRGGRTLAQPFLDVSSQVTSGGEQGLLSIAFPPDYAESGRFYVYFTDRDERQRIVEYRRSAQSEDRADPSSARVVLVMDDPEANHNGGQMTFGPDGLLYVATGDGGGANDQHGSRGNAQDLGSLLGKLLRIDPRADGDRAYRVPASNPFVGRDGAQGQVYAYGLRNPWRFSFDRATGALTIGDVGQNEIEEIDYVAKGKGRGANFGWRPFEGSKRIFDEPAPGAVKPVLEHAHDSGFCSITGGYVVRDPSLPALRGRYVYGDFCEGKLRSARLTTRGARERKVLPLKKVGSLASFGEDARGRVYVVSLEGPIYRLAAR